MLTHEVKANLPKNDIDLANIAANNNFSTKNLRSRSNK